MDERAVGRCVFDHPGQKNAPEAPPSALRSLFPTTPFFGLIASPRHPLHRVLCAGSAGDSGTSRGSTPSNSESPEAAATGTMSHPHNSVERQSTPPEEPQKLASRNSMRRNYTASDALMSHGAPAISSMAGPTPQDNTMSPGMRRNTSAATLCELRRREQLAMSKADTQLKGSRAAVVEAVACRMLEHILGTDAALMAMRVALAKAETEPAPSDRPDSFSKRAGEAEGAAGSSSSSLAEDEARLAELGVPAGISQSLQVRPPRLARLVHVPPARVAESHRGPMNTSICLH